MSNFPHPNQKNVNFYGWMNFCIRQDQNIVDSFDLGVAGYIVKPVDYKQFVEAMRTVDMYWTLCLLPEVGKSHVSLQAQHT